MGSIFSPPKAPPLPALPSEPTPPPVASSPDVTKARARASTRTTALGRNRAGTLFTGPQGVLESAYTTGKTALGA